MITVSISHAPSVARHFLLADTVVSCVHTVGSTIRPASVSRSEGAFSVTIDGAIAGTLEIVIETRYHFDGQTWLLSRIRQVFAVGGPTQPNLVPVRWFKAASVPGNGVPINIPPLHPHLKVQGLRVTVTCQFLDITDLFMYMHGRTPWFRALAIVKSTDFSLRVLAFLGGRPFIWYVVIPSSAAKALSVTPHLSFWAADYGGIDYVHNTQRGLSTRNHSTTVNRVQCGGNMLCSYLLSPLTHAAYLRTLPFFTVAQTKFEDYRSGPGDEMPPELHRMRSVLGFQATDKVIWPKNWDIPFGFERTIDGTDHVLIFPQVHGGDAGLATRPGLKHLVESALSTIASQTMALTAAGVAANPLILSCYSESGGNLFTACDNNLNDLKAIICVEPQYMNDYLDGENRNHVLGRIVIPKLIRNKVKVVIIARRAEAWQRQKYLPRGVPLTSLTLLPSEQHLGVVSYPPDPSHPFQKHRLGRLLTPANDETTTYILGTEGKRVLHPRVPGMELLVTFRIEDFRKQGLSDKQVIASVFPSILDNDNGGGSFTHNFMISGGEDPSVFAPNGDLKPGKHVRTFMQQALDVIGQ